MKDDEVAKILINIITIKIQYSSSYYKLRV